MCEQIGAVRLGIARCHRRKGRCEITVARRPHRRHLGARNRSPSNFLLDMGHRVSGLLLRHLLNQS